VWRRYKCLILLELKKAAKSKITRGITSGARAASLK
jgi:hypothetical protein